MAQYINKSALIAEIDKRLHANGAFDTTFDTVWAEDVGMCNAYKSILSFINTLEVKEVDEQKERISECPRRQVVCTMYTDKMLECNGACSWVVDYPRLKKFKAQKGE